MSPFWRGFLNEGLMIFYNIECADYVESGNRNMKESKSLVLAGAGEYGRRWAEKLKRENVEVLCFADVDCSKEGQSLCGKKIVSYDELGKMHDKIDIFITVLNGDVRREIEHILAEKKLADCLVKNPYIDNEVCLDSYICNSILEGRNLLLPGVSLIDSYLGRYSYLSKNSSIIKAKVGRYTCIGPEVKIIFGQHPTSKFVSIHPAFYSTQNGIGYSFVKKEKFEEVRFANQTYGVVIGNDVWIGAYAKIMEGVTIADGTIIAAGAVVVKDTEPFEIVGGVPASHIRYRFGERERNELLQLEWWNKDTKWIMEHAEEFENINSFLKNIEESDNECGY